MGQAHIQWYHSVSLIWLLLNLANPRNINGKWKQSCFQKLRPSYLYVRFHITTIGNIYRCIRLADPDFGIPGYVDVLLGADIFSRAIRQGRRLGPPGTPSAIETSFGWVLSGVIRPKCSQQHVITCFSSVLPGDDLLQKFWEVESCDVKAPPISLNEKVVVRHFKANYRRDEAGRFIVPLPMKKDPEPLGESRSSAIQRLT